MPGPCCVPWGVPFCCGVRVDCGITVWLGMAPGVREMVGWGPGPELPGVGVPVVHGLLPWLGPAGVQVMQVEVEPGPGP